MSLFFLAFFALYGCMHLYAFFRIRSAFHPAFPVQILLAVLMLVMTLAPFFIRIAERQGYETFARIFSVTGYGWMGLLFIFCSCSLTLDLYRLVIRAAEEVLRSDLSRMKPSAFLLFLLPFVWSCAIAAYAYSEALHIRTEHVVLQTRKLPEAVDRLRIVQISDVHLGLVVRQERLGRILAAVRAAQPDMLVSTGDLVDGQINGMPGLAEMLGSIRPRFGKYAITGNHEFYAGFAQAMDFTRHAGFTVLRGRRMDIPGVISIAGTDDPAGRSVPNEAVQTEQEILMGVPKDVFVLLLKHRPYIDKRTVGRFDLQLSGHVHRGQIFPFSLLTGLLYPVQSGYAEIGSGSRLYVSRGSGTWGPPMRFLSPPEVSVIDLVRLK